MTLATCSEDGMGRYAYLSGEIGSVDPGSAAEPGIELDLGVFGAVARGGPHCHRHWSRSQKQLAVCWCGGSSGKYGTGCGVAVVGWGDMAVAFLGVVSSGCGCGRGVRRSRHVDGVAAAAGHRAGAGVEAGEYFVEAVADTPQEPAVAPSSA